MKGATRKSLAVALFLVIGILGAPVWAEERIEMSTYVPAVMNGDLDRLHAKRATIGPPYSMTNPAEPAPDDGTLLVSQKVGIGIGTASPATALDVASGNAIRLQHAYLFSGIGIDGSNLAQFASNAWWDGGAWHFPDPAHKAGLLQLQDDQLAYWQQDNTGSPAMTLRLLVAHNGNVGVGTMSPGATLEVAGSLIVDHSLGGIYVPATVPSYNATGVHLKAKAGRPYIAANIGTSDANSGFVVINSSDVYCLAARGDGNLWIKGTLTENSDARYKKEIQPIPQALERICSLQGINFRWSGEGYDSRLQMGILGQEVEKIFPELVYSDSHGAKSVAYTHLTAALIEAVKELKGENDTLKREVENLERKVELLEKVNGRGRAGAGPL